MESIKDKLVNNIKEWIQLDNEIIQLNSEVKKRKTKKKELTDSLVNIMKEEHLDCLNINGGSLVYKANKEIVYYQDLTKEYVLNKFNHLPYINMLDLKYGEKVYDIRVIGAFKKYNPIFLHPEINIFEHENGKLVHKDKIIFE